MPAIVGGAAEKAAITLLKTADQGFAAAIEGIARTKADFDMGAFSAMAGDAVGQITGGVEALEGVSLIKGLAADSPLLVAGNAALTSAKAAQGSLGWGQLFGAGHADGILAELLNARTAIAPFLP